MLPGNEAVETRIVSVCTLEDEALVSRPTREVWDKAVGESRLWWPEALKVGSRGVSIEPRVGGRIWQEYDEPDSGLLYGTVVAIEPPKMIHFTSTLSIAGVALSAQTWMFSECGPGTLVNVSVQLLSEFPERLMCSLIKRQVRTMLESLQRYVSASSAAANGALKACKPESSMGIAEHVASGNGISYCRWRYENAPQLRP
jgi:hypothetical protein